MNGYSFLCQVLQVGLVGPYIILKINQQPYSSVVGGALVSLVWAMVIAFGGVIPKVLGRLGLFRANCLSILSTLIGFSLLAFCDTALAYAIGAVSIGIALVIRWISCDALVIQLSTDTGVGRNIGIHEMLMGAGIAAGPLLLSLSTLGVYSVFIAVVGVSVLASAALAAALKSATYPFGTPKIINSSGWKAASDNTAALKVLHRAVLCAFASGFCEASFIAYLPDLVIGYGHSLAAAGFVGFLFGLGGTLLQPPIGWAADRLEITRAQPIYVAVIVATVFILAIIPAFDASFTDFLVSAIVFLCGGVIGGANTLAVIECGKALANSQVEKGVARIATAYTTGAVIGPLLIGAVTSLLGQAALFYVCGLSATLLLSVLMTRISETQRL